MLHSTITGFRTMESMLHIFVLLSMAVFVFGCSPCDYNLVTGPYGVSDDAFSASSTHANCPIEDARFSSPKSWCSIHLEIGPFLQVKFRSVSLLKAVQTKGREDADQWVTSYSVNVSMDGLIWTTLMNAKGDVKVFPGNFDENTVVTNILRGNVIAQYIRVISVASHRHSSMRLEVQGCPYSEINSTCRHWEAKLGSIGDMRSVLLDTVASGQGQCGLQCSKKPECNSFLFDVTSGWCRLLKDAVNGSHSAINFNGIWYFVKM